MGGTVGVVVGVREGSALGNSDGAALGPAKMSVGDSVITAVGGMVGSVSIAARVLCPVAGLLCWASGILCLIGRVASLLCVGQQACSIEQRARFAGGSRGSLWRDVVSGSGPVVSAGS